MTDAPVERQDPKLGTVLNGTYRLEAVIGTGGMGTVYQARHIHLGTQYAIKSLVPQFTDNNEAIKRFQREAQIASQLGHPNIVKVIDFNYDAVGVPFMVMDLLRGETLRTRLARAGKLPLREALPIVTQLCAGLDAAHARGVVHRDLKPENLFLCEGTDQVKILDFGISKIKNFNTQLTRPTAMLGTPYYMSPEQAMGNTAEVGHLSDVWAVGALVFEMLTGQGAFAAENPVAVFYRIVNEPFPEATACGADVPRAVDRVLAKACAKPPAERYQSTGELARGLEEAALATDQHAPLTVEEAQRILAGQPLAPRRTPMPRTKTPPTEERPTLQPAALPALETKILPSLADQETRLTALPDEKPPLAAQETRLIQTPPTSPVVRSLADDIANESTALNDQPRAPALSDDEGEEEKTAVTGARAAAPVGTGEETAQVVLPAPGAHTNGVQRPPIAAPVPPLAPPVTAATPVAAGEQRKPEAARTMIRAPRPKWQIAAIAVGAALAVAAVIGLWASSRRQAERVRLAVDDAIAEKRWDDAEQALRALAARGGDAAELQALGAKVSAERRAAESLKLAREMRQRGDGAAAWAELSLIDAKSVYAPEAVRERAAVVGAVQDELEKAIEERRCRDAQAAAKRLTALDPGRALPPALAQCRDAEPSAPSAPRGSLGDAQHAYKRHDYERALSLAQALVKEDPADAAAWRVLAQAACMAGNPDEAHRARPHLARGDQHAVDKLCRGRHAAPHDGGDAPVAEGSTQARDMIGKMLASASGFARKCFAREPSYRAPMKLRLSAFPGSDHFVATAISTGPVEIRSCLEGLFRNVRPPRVTAAVSAERLFSPDEE